MSNEVITGDQVASIAALKHYVTNGSKCCKRHEANILVHANGKDLCAGVRIVFISICEGNEELIIDDFHTIYEACTNRFTLRNCLFSTNNKSLQVKTKDKFDRDISISITAL